MLPAREAFGQAAGLRGFVRLIYSWLLKTVCSVAGWVLGMSIATNFIAACACYIRVVAIIYSKIAL
jgi:hypothetical protein